MGISGINQIQNAEAKKSYSKLSFKVGETFSARVVSEDADKGEVVLKLSDGWQFPAKMDKPLKDITDKQLLKFEVDGLEDGKLKIKLVTEENVQENSELDSFEQISKGVNIKLSKEDYALMEKMMKIGIPLTKENIVELKTLMEFRNKILNNSFEEDNFIEKYLNGRNIDINSEKGKDIARILKGFFSELKNLNLDEILILKQNNIELNEKNMKCFNDIFKGSNSIYKGINDIKNYIDLNDMTEQNDVNLEKNNELNKSENTKVNDSSNMNLNKKDNTGTKTIQFKSKETIDSNNIIKSENAETINKNTKIDIGSDVFKFSTLFKFVFLKTQT